MWEQKFRGHYNGGVLTTAGNLVFQGNADGEFVAYAADSGKVLWRFAAEVGIIGAPISFRVGGRQYIALVAGFGGSGGIAGDLSRKFGWDARLQKRRVLVFALDRNAKLPAPEKVADAPFIEVPGFTIDPAVLEKGNILYSHTCYACHGMGAVAGGTAPELRRSAIMADLPALTRLLREGQLEASGMPKFADLSDAEIAGIRSYVIMRAREGAAKAAAGAKAAKP